MIYFVRSLNTGNIKIGWSGNVERRMIQLKAEHGKLELLGVIPGGRAFENALHRAFDTYRVESFGREWFADNRALRSYILTYASKPNVLLPEYRHKLHKPVYKVNSVNCHLYELVLKKRQESGFEDFDIYSLSSETGIAVNVLDRLIRNQARTYKDAHCDTLIRFFNCDVGDLLTYTPDAQPS